MFKHKGKFFSILIGILFMIAFTACKSESNKNKQNSETQAISKGSSLSHTEETSEVVNDSNVSYSDSYVENNDSEYVKIDDLYNPEVKENISHMNESTYLDGINDKEIQTTISSESSSTESETKLNAYVVNTETKRTINKTESIKYGATRKYITEYIYEIYSDDTKKLVDTQNKIVVDRSTYCATDEMLMDEADNNAYEYSDYWAGLLKLINDFRSENGIAAVQLDETLCKAACIRAVEIDYSAYFSHLRPDGKNAFSVFDCLDYSACIKGENLAGGQKTPEEVVEAWKKSTMGHRELLLNVSVTKLGCGYSYSGTIGYPVWTLEMTN